MGSSPPVPYILSSLLGLCLDPEQGSLVPGETQGEQDPEMETGHRAQILIQGSPGRATEVVRLKEGRHPLA